MRVEAGAATDAGTRRSHNEDSYLCDEPVFLVADGMGGYEAGEVASAAVIEAFRALAGTPSVDLEAMRSAYADAGRRVSSLNHGNAPAGTTLSGLGIAVHDGSPYWLVINVGDSRTYRLVAGELEQVSVDHSVVQELVESGELTRAEAATDKRRNVVTRAIGAGGVSEADFWMIPALRGDRMLVCSDGLSGELTDARIAEVLTTTGSPKTAAQHLVHEALVKGGRDNITAIVVDAVFVTSADDVDAHVDTVPRMNVAGGV
ncbi:MAG: serine/threonine protein phosphatase [Actinobacteria bacterium HGW-Actinobacteria-4]|nr:MAG: serine/threonine protein phosphatase [Actinobacteria bacterium HGW-Actinobacteria-4]